MYPVTTTDTYATTDNDTNDVKTDGSRTIG
jgi:hypothetical protein